MNNNAKLNLNGIFGFNKLLVGKVNVEPDVINNTVDIKYIYNNVLTSLQNQMTTTVRNALNASEVITTINSTLNSFQTNLTNQITKEASDVSNLQGQINSNYTTLDTKYNQKVDTLTTKQTDLQSQITTLSNTQANSNINTNNAYTWKGAQTFTGGVSITGGLTTITRDMTIGSNSERTLTVNSSPTFNSGLTVASGSVSFPAKSIDASCIANIPTGISVSNAYTWKEIQTFQKGISTNGETNTGSITVSGDTTLGTSDANSLTINATPVISSTPTFNKGLNVVNGPVYFPSQSISFDCVVGLLSVNNSNTWNQTQIFKGGLVVNGTSALNSVYLQSDDIILGKNSGSSIMVKASPLFQNGLTVSSGSISIPNNALPIASISGLNTQLNSLQSSIASQVAKEASDFSNLQLQITNISTTPGATGAKGDKGDTGPAGKDGTNGKDGINGTNGKDGVNGKDGANGLNGINGTNGAKGDTGPAGPTGPSGASQLGVVNNWTAKQTFSQGFTVPTGATVSFPNNSISASCINGLSSGGVSTSTENAWNALQTFNYGLTVPSGAPVSFPDNSIPYTCITGLPSSSTIPIGTQTNINLSETRNWTSGLTSVRLPFTIPYIYNYNTIDQTITLFSCSAVNGEDTHIYMVQMDLFFFGGNSQYINDVHFTILNGDTTVFDNTYTINFAWGQRHYSDTFVLACNYSTKLRFLATTQNTGVVGSKTYTHVLNSVNLTFTRIA